MSLALAWMRIAASTVPAEDFPMAWTATAPLERLACTAALSSHASDASRGGPLAELAVASGGVFGSVAPAGARASRKAARMELSVVSHLLLVRTGHLGVGTCER